MGFTSNTGNWTCTSPPSLPPLIQDIRESRPLCKVHGAVLLGLILFFCGCNVPPMMQQYSVRPLELAKQNRPSPATPGLTQCLANFHQLYSDWLYSLLWFSLLHRGVAKKITEWNGYVFVPPSTFPERDLEEFDIIGL